MAYSGLVTDYLGNGLAADRLAAPNVGVGVLAIYYATDTVELSVWDGTVWTTLGGWSAPLVTGISSNLIITSGTLDVVGIVAPSAAPGSGTAGNSVTIQGGAGDGAGYGGDVNLYGGTTSDGYGGPVTITGGDASGPLGYAGSLLFSGGNAFGASGLAGSISLSTGVGIGGSAGADLNFYTGGGATLAGNMLAIVGNADNGPGGHFYVLTGSGGGATGDGGYFRVIAGNGSGTGVGGAIQFQVGVAGDGVTPGHFTINGLPTADPAFSDALWLDHGVVVSSGASLAAATVDVQRSITATTTATIDPAGIQSCVVHIGATNTTLTIAPGYAGQTLRLEIKQGATPHLVALDTTFVFSADITSYTATAVAGARDMVLAICLDGTSWGIGAINKGFTI